MAYKILIVEDEQEEYELVLYLFRKMNLDSYLQIYHAENGKQALELLEQTQFELLLTDIEMPFANGLEIAAKARAAKPQLPIVFFSCYDNFSYVKTALSVQADNYLLKPLDPDEFEKTMLHVFSLLQQAEAQKKQQESRLRVLKNHCLYLKLNRMPCGEFPEMEDTDFIDRYILLILLHFEEAFFDCDPNISEVFISLLEKMIPFSFDVMNLNPSQSVLLFQKNEKIPIDQESLAEFCRQAHEQILEEYRMKCYFAISSPLSSGFELSDAYEDACGLLESRFFYQDRYVFHKQFTKEPALYENNDLCSDILNSVRVASETQNMEQLTANILKLNGIFEQSKKYSHIYVRYIYSSLIQILYTNRESSEMPGDIERIFSCSFISEIEQIVFAVLARLQTENHTSSPSRKHVIQLAKQYIHKHYSEQISLNELAGAVYLNPSYLSTVFKIETGNNINKYIKMVRMEKAREILTRTNIKVSDAGAAVGYANTSYFIRSFHEYFGETPDKMRQK